MAVPCGASVVEVAVCAAAFGGEALVGSAFRVEVARLLPVCGGCARLASRLMFRFAPAVLAGVFFIAGNLRGGKKKQKHQSDYYNEPPRTAQLRNPNVYEPPPPPPGRGITRSNSRCGLRLPALPLRAGGPSLSMLRDRRCSIREKRAALPTRRRGGLTFFRMSTLPRRKKKEPAWIKSQIIGNELY